jgi:hypothetical protein
VVERRARQPPPRHHAADSFPAPGR